MELWNRKMFCWVNKGAKGIALFDCEDDRKQRLRYVFDVSDVHAARRIGRLPKLWEIKKERISIKRKLAELKNVIPRQRNFKIEK